MKRHCAVFLTCLACLFLARATAGQDDGEPVVMALVLQDARAGAEPAKLDEWVAEELKKQQIGATVIQRLWFRLTNEAVTIHDTKLYGTLTMRLAGPREAEVLTVLLAGSGSQRIPLARKDGATKLIRHELSNHLGEKLPFYLALRVEKAAAGAPAPLEIGSDANGKTVGVTGVSRVMIRLPGNVTTGYGWVVGKLEGTAVQADGSVQYLATQPKPGQVGTGGFFEAYFRVMAQGKATVTMEYRRPWEKEKPAEKTFTVTLDVQDVPEAK